MPAEKAHDQNEAVLQSDLSRFLLENFLLFLKTCSGDAPADAENCSYSGMAFERLAAVVCCSPETIQAATTRAIKSFDIQNRRINHALSRLKEKGLWGGTQDKVIDLLAQNSPNTIAPVFIELVLHKTVHEATISDEVWKVAVELTMLTCNWAVYSVPDAMWGRAIMDYLPQLYCFVLFLNAIGNKSIIQKTLERIEEERSQQDSMEETVQAARSAGIRISELQEKLAQADQAFSQAKREEFRNTYMLRKRVHEQEAEIQRLRSLMADHEADSDVPIEPADVTEQIASSEPVEDIDLPENGILFVGGHENMVKKLKALYPGWKYVAADQTFGSRSMGSTVFAFVWSNHLSHKTYNYYVNALPADVPVFFLDATNIDLLQAQAKSRMLEYIKNGVCC